MKNEQFNCELCQFPFKSVLSFEWLVKYWQKASENENLPECPLAKKIVEELKDAPELLKPITDYSVLDKHEKLIKMMTTVLIPAAMEDEISATTTPYSSETAYVTPKFAELFGKDWTKYEDIIIQDNNLDDILYRKTLHAYAALFRQLYGIELPLNHHILCSVKDQTTGLNKHYKIEINNKFTQVFHVFG